MSKRTDPTRWAWLWLWLWACGHDAAPTDGVAAGSGAIGADAAGTAAAGKTAADGGGSARMAAGAADPGGGGTSAAAGRGGSGRAAGGGGTSAVAGASGLGGAAGRGGGGAGRGGGGAGRGGAGAGRGGAGAAAQSGAGAAGSGGSLTATIVDATIVVGAGQSFDGTGKRFIAGAALGDGSQSETQKPVFRLEAGAKLSNVVLGSPAADGIHCYGDATLHNIVWEDIGEDALTIKASGMVTLDGGSATDGSDKVFQINAASTFKVSNFRASHAGKFIRQNGGTTFRVDVTIEACDISDMDEAIFRTDSSTSTVQMTNTRYSMIGEQLFMGVAASNISSSNNTEY
jgi:hypothetical protein